MKKIYLSMMVILAFAGQSQTNFTLTRAGQEPVAGDVFSTQDYDSVGVVPKSTGSGQFWNFASTVQNTNTALSSFVSTVAVPASSVFPGATLVEDQGQNNYNFWKSANTPTTQWEMLGSLNTATTPAQGVKFSNSAIAGIWPMAPGDTYTDTFSGTIVGLPFGSGSVLGSQTVTSSGTGSITLPNGQTYSNIVQIKMKQTYTANISVLTFTFKTIDTTTQYMYFNPTQKFQLLQVSYGSTFDGTTTTKSFQMSANKNITIGLRDQAFSKSFDIYPNPAQNNFHFRLSNANGESCTLRVINILGQELKVLPLGNAALIDEKIDIANLPKGTYIVQTQLGDKSESRRLVVE